MMDRDQAFELLQQAITEENMLHHALETEAVMRGLARELNQDQELWGITGLLHDLDFARTREKPEEHGLLAADELRGRLPDEALHAIRAHNGECNGTKPETDFDWALRCGETVTGLVSANAMVRPEKMRGMKPKSLKKKMKTAAFAANVNRDIIRECEKLGLDLDRFLQTAIDSITAIADQVGLGA